MFDYLEPPPVDFEPKNSPGTVAFQLTRLHVEIPRRLDWGDAPDPTFPTLLASNGARHVIRPGYSLGPAIDPDANGQPHAIALGDDGDADGDDEDGVAITSPIVPGGVATVNVTAVGGRGYLNAWADFNRNGVWEPAEQIFTSELLNMGVNALAFAVPAATLPDVQGIPPLISRWRFSRQKVLPTIGLSSSGEVEDHLLRITRPNVVEVDHFPNAAAALTLRHSDGTLEQLQLAGMTTVHVRFEGPEEGDAQDDDNDGLDDVMAEVVAMEMSADTARGRIVVREAANRASTGVTEETANQMAGELDVAPFGMGTADSFFDVFVEVDLPVGPTVRRFRSTGPVRLQGLISHKPPAAGETLCMPQGTPPVDLVDENGQPTGIQIVNACHTPIPRPVVEVDQFLNSLAQLELNIPGRAPQIISLTGETKVNVYFEGPADGDADDDDGDGRDEVQTEIVSMQLAGFYALPEVGDEVLVLVRQSPSRRSVGQIEETANGTTGRLDLPPFADDGTADSFFDVFFEIDIPGLGLRLHNEQPSHKESVIRHKPPRPGDRYDRPTSDPIKLYDENGNLTNITIGRVRHIPNPPVERDFFRNSEADVELIDPQGNRHMIRLSGETTVDVYFEGDVEGSAGDEGGMQGHDEVATQIVAMHLMGGSPAGPVMMRLQAGVPSMGEIEETEKIVAGMLDVPPFGRPGTTADSFFDVFFEVDLGGQIMHPERPKHMQAVITHKPPAPGDRYQNQDVIRLLDEQNRPTGWSIGNTVHTPRPKREIIPAAGPSPKVVVGQQDNQHLAAVLQLGQPAQVPVYAGNDEWTQLLMEGAEALIGEVGMPAIPVVRRLVAIPMGAQVQPGPIMCETTVGQTLHGVNLLPLQHTALDGEVEPPPPRELFADPPGFSKNESLYAEDKFFPTDPCYFRPLGKMRDLEVGLLEFYTGRYNPAQHVLQTFERIEFDLRFTGGTGNFLPHQATNPFENSRALYDGVLNAGIIYDYVDDFIPIWPCINDLSEGSELIILTHPDFRDAADDLADWKRDKGITTSIFEVGTGTGRDTKEEIYDLLDDLWENCEVRPSYVLLLGDAEFIPPWYRSTYYAGGDGGPAYKKNQDASSGQWVSLGQHYMNDDGAEYVTLVRPDRDDDNPDFGSTSADAVKFVRLSDNNTTIVDNQDAGFSSTGDWNESIATDEYDGSSLYTFEDGATAKFTPALPGEGLYEVFAWWSRAWAGGNLDRDSTATYYVSCDCTGTDTPYAYLADSLFNFLPDVAISRIPVDTLTQAQTIVDKSINYEQNPPGGFLNPFYENATVVSHFQGYQEDDPAGRDKRAFVEVSEEARDTLMGHGKTVERIYTKTEDDFPSQGPPEKYYDGTLLPAALRGGFPWDGDTTDIINSFNDNDGRFLITHRDHGSRSGWAEPNFDYNDVPSLSNGELLPVVYSVNCASGWFDNETSGMGASTSTTYFSEKLLREADGGAVGIIGDTRNSNTWSNTAFYRGLIDATWTNHDSGYGGGTSIRRLADIMNYAKEYTLMQIGVAGSTPAVDVEFGIDTLYLYHTFGDPTLEMWTTNPNNFILQSDLVFELIDPRHLEITYPTPGAKVTAYQVIGEEIVPLTRGTVANDGGDMMLATIADINPQVPIQFAVCRDDAVCVKPVATPRPRLDFGDAPDPTFPTRLASNGARHTVGQLFLGTKIDAEPDGQPHPIAQGDDAPPSDDEDGVVPVGPIVRGQIARLEVTASQQALLQGFADWNHNGVWAAGEQIFANQPVVAGVNNLSFNVPSSALLGPTFFRFRLSTSAGLGPAGILPTGGIPNGEVEDYRFDVVGQANSPAAPDADPPAPEAIVLHRALARQTDAAVTQLVDTTNSTPTRVLTARRIRRLPARAIDEALDLFGANRQ
ncbi:MAG: C25 family cysteine peptidase [Pirellulales bacterium]